MKNVKLLYCHLSGHSKHCLTTWEAAIVVNEAVPAQEYPVLKPHFEILSVTIHYLFFDTHDTSARGFPVHS
jgi:hypothetical protein